MRNVSAVNRWIGVAGLTLCVLLAVLALPGWWYLRHHWVPDDAIVRSQMLRPGLMLYVVRRNAGRAAPSFFYDYYLTGRHIDRSSLGSLMDRRAPFLTTDTDRAEIGLDDRESLCVSLLGHVSGFANKVTLDTGGERRAIVISIAARAPAGSAPDVSREALRAVRNQPNGQHVNEGAGGAASVCKMQP